MPDSKACECNDNAMKHTANAKLCELQESIDWYKESTNHVVKDICIDDGVPSRAKVFFGGDVDATRLKSHLSFDNNGNEKDRDCIKITSPKANLASPTLVSHAAKASKDSSKDILLHPPPVHAAENSIKSSPARDLSYNRKVESGSITFNFHPADYSHGESSFRTPNMFENRLSNNQTLRNLFQQGHGEASFSATSTLSVFSISLRSDGNTTSNRSFAFPILQPEWNSSPEKMAKADPTPNKKYKSWKQRLLCCKF